MLRPVGEDADLFSGSGNVNGDAPKASVVEDNGFPDLGRFSIYAQPATSTNVHPAPPSHSLFSDDFTSSPAPPPAAQQPPTSQPFSAMDDTSDPMSNFPSFDAPPTGGQPEYKVTGHEGTGVEEDEERARFESSFPDIGGEASAIEVSWQYWGLWGCPTFHSVRCS